MTIATQSPRPLTISNETILRFVLFLMLAIGSFAFIEPSPYEFVFFLMAPLVIFSHLVLTRVTMLMIIIILTFLAAEVVSLLPYLQDRPTIAIDSYGSSATVYTFESIYVFCSAIMFAIIFTRQTQPRLKIALVAYAVSCVFAALVAIAEYLNLTNLNLDTIDTTRMAGPFKDPNVLGSYTVLGALYLIQVVLMTSRTRTRLISLIALCVVLFGGLFLPLSRGAAGAMAFSLLYFTVVTFFTSDRKMRRKLLLGAALLGLVVGIGSAFIAADPDMIEKLSTRAKVEQDYDGGPTGRFGNQKRSIPMLLERPLGFGPHRFTMYFDLDPHNSYIGAFSSAGWVGGAAFLVLAITTCFLAVRLSVTPTPYLREAQVIAPAVISALLQAVQIDVDHWRFIHLTIGAIWGMEAARQLALAKLKAPSTPPILDHNAEYRTRPAV